MKSTTSIEWTNHTINFWWGCTKVSPACTHCYAEEMGKSFGPRLFGQPVLWGAGKPRFERLEAARKEALKIQRLFLNEIAELLQITRKRANDLCCAENWDWLERVFFKTGIRPRRPRVFVNWLDEEVPLEWLAFLLETIWPCDRWRTIAENVQAIAKTIEALRGIERWGAKHMVKAAFRGFAALPEKASSRTCWQVLGLLSGSQQTRDHIETAYRAKAKECHPDAGGTHEQMAELNEARQQALQSITG